jgi:uncharacterized protein
MEKETDMRPKLYLLFVFTLLTQLACNSGLIIEPIQADIERGRISEVKARLDQGYDVNKQTGSKETTLLMFAVRHGQEAIVQLLLDRGADVQVKNAYGFTALEHIIMIDKSEVAAKIIRALLDKGADIETRDNFTMTPLIAAARWGKTVSAKIFLDNGADINARISAAYEDPLAFQGPEGTTALMLAARGGHLETVKLLLERGADVNATDSEGCTALGQAVWGEHQAVQEKLKKAGGEPGAKSRRQKPENYSYPSIP